MKKILRLLIFLILASVTIIAIYMKTAQREFARPEASQRTDIPMPAQPDGLGLDSNKEPVMSDEQFWSLIDRIEWMNEADASTMFAPLIEQLIKLKAEEILGFQERLAQHLYELDGKEFARPGIIFSADQFLYTRCYVVAKGKSYFHSVLEDPSKLQKDQQLERLLYAAPEAFEKATGQTYNYLTTVSFETGSNASGWKKE